jgi:hypothetical protein
VNLVAAGAGSDPELALLDQIRGLMRNLNATLALRDRDHLPEPDRHVDPAAQGARGNLYGLMAHGGVEWQPTAEKWIVKVPLADDDAEHFVYVETPRDWDGDVTPVRIGDARALGLALVAAADWASNELWRRHGR